MTNILSFGGGVDSTCLIAIDQHRDIAAAWLNITREHLDLVFPVIDHTIFSDTGAEHDWTYENIKRFGNSVTIVRREGETITEWCERLGIVPLMPGASHVCSLKFKGEVMAKWAKENGITHPTWIIGIEADEGNRVKRFQKPKDSTADYIYPLVELGMTRKMCQDFLALLDWTVEKSSCVFCPFKSEDEIHDMYLRDRKAWEDCERIEAAFEKMSAIKHQRWLDNGKPLNKGGRAPRGMWRKDSWASGARLFAKKIDGKQLSLKEWAARFDNMIVKG